MLKLFWETFLNFTLGPKCPFGTRDGCIPCDLCWAETTVERENQERIIAANKRSYQVAIIRDGILAAKRIMETN